MEGGACVPQKEPFQGRRPVFQPLCVRLFGLVTRRRYRCRRFLRLLITVVFGINPSDFSCSPHFRLRIAQPRKITRARLNVAGLKQMVTLCELTWLADLAVRVLS